MQAVHTLHFICSNCRADAGGIDATAWATIALAGVTTLLALATFRSVREAKRSTQAAVAATQAAIAEAKATENLAAQSGEQLRRSYLPIVVPIHAGRVVMSTGGAPHTNVDMRIANVGTGPALNLSLEIAFQDGEDRQTWGGASHIPVVAPGETETVARGYGIETSPEFTIRVSFRDAFRGRYVSTCRVNGTTIIDVAMVAVDDAGNTIETIVE